MRLRSALALACLLSLSACDEGPRETSRLVQIVGAPAGDNPLDGSGTLTIVVDQFDVAPRQTLVTDYAAGTFDLDATIASYLAPTRISVEIESEDGDLQIGAVPTFAPFYVGFARAVVGPPLTCARLDEPQLPHERVDPALVAQSSHLWVIGGTRMADSTDVPLDISAPQLTWPEAIVDPTTVSGLEFEPFSRGLRETQAMLLGDTGRIVVLSTGFAFVWRASEAEQAIAVAAEADARTSTLVSLGNDGVAIVGGGDVGDPDARSRALTWIAADGTASSSELAFARRSPAAAYVGGELVIAGGQADGEPLFEVASLRSSGVELDGTGTEGRARPIFARDPQRRSAALLGGRRADDTLAADVLLVTGCPACVVTPLPAENDWPTPREAPAVVETADGTWLLGGIDATGEASAAADRVTVTNVATSIHELALDQPRAHAAGAELAQGIVVLAGGLGAGPSAPDVDTLTVCWPRELEPMD